MAGTTPRWGFTTLGTGDSISDNGFKFSDDDRHLLDRLLQYATEQHRHTGAAGTDNAPQLAPALTVLTTGGRIPSGSRYYYRFTYVDDYNFETAPSPAVFADTIRSIDSPAAPTLSFVTGSGTLLPGAYSYVLSAYVGANTLETKAVNSGNIIITGTNTANEVSLILPAMPPGAAGYNVYRKAPGGLHYLYLTTITNPTPLQVWVDDGSLDPDCDRTLPSTNLTSNTNAITITLPGATPALPAGIATWRIYRTSDPNNWARSRLAELVAAGGTTPVSFDDIGGATTQGAPPSRTQVFSSPPKIDLATETTGSLPPGRITTTQIVRFAQDQNPPVLPTVGPGTFHWICDYDEIDIVSCRAYLIPGSAPAADPLIVDIHAFRPSVDATPDWTTIYTTQANRPTIDVGDDVGDATTPDVTRLQAGDELRVDVDQVGGGATPTDFGLAVNVLMYVKHGSETNTAPW